MKENKILILGIGNYLLGDEGIGIHAVRALETESLPANVVLLDGGTGGFHLMEHLQSYEKIIMIDAFLSSSQPGTVNVLTPKYAKDFPRSLSAHDIGLKDMLESIALLDKLPDITLITVTINTLKEGLSIDLTDELRNSIPEVVGKVKEVLKDIGSL